MQLSVAPLGPLPERVRVTGLAYVVTVLPPASCPATTGCEANAVPLVELALGGVVKPSFTAEPTVITTDVVAEVNNPSVAVSV